MPAPAQRAFCLLQPSAPTGSPHPQLTGRILFDAGEDQSNVLVRGRVCGVPAGRGRSLRLRQCPHTTIHVSSYTICVLVLLYLLYVSSYSSHY